MLTTISALSFSEIHPFWLLFKEVLQTEFPGYSPDTIKTFLEKLYTEDAYRYYLDNKMKYIYTAKVEAEMVGFAVIDEPYGGVSLLRWLGVKKEYQHTGLGTRLVQTWLNVAISQGCHKAEVASQPSAKDFYAKTGLNLEGMRKNSYFGIDQYLFGKVLKEITENG